MSRLRTAFKPFAVFACSLLLFGIAVCQAYVPGEVLVRFRPGAELPARAAMLQWSSQAVETIGDSGIWRVLMPRGTSVQGAVAAYRRLPFVEFAEPNYLVKAAFTPNDPSFPSQWNLSKIHCEQAWDVTFGLPSVVVAIVDSGIDLTHPDLAAKIVPGWDFANGDPLADDDYGHGTHCAGTAGATTDNAVGIAGVGFNCRLMPVKVLDSNGLGTTANVAQGVIFAADNGAKVVSLSLVSSGNSATLRNAVDYAWNHGVVVCCAAGNAGTTAPQYPAAYTNSIAVASTTSSDTRSSFSTYGSWVDVAAPGSGIYSTVNHSGYATKSGTSMAAPHVTGLAGLLWSYFGTSRSATFIRQRIEDNCDPVGNFVVHGRINAELALGGPPQMTFAPASISLLRGAPVSGGVSSLGSSDDVRMVVRSIRSGPSRFVRWTADFETGAREVLSGLRLTIEGRCTVSTNVSVFAWDFDGGTWVFLGSARMGFSDATFPFMAPGTGESLQSPSGLVRLMVNVVRPGGGGLDLSTDFVELTKSL